MSLEIKKISYIQETVEITVINPQRKEKDVKECKEKPLPSFDQCLQELAAVRQYLPLDHSKVEEIKVKSVSIKYDAGSPASAVIGITIHLKDEGGAWNVNSQWINLDDSALISGSVENVINEAKKYLNYERAQGEFFEDENDKNEPEKKNMEASHGQIED